MVMTGEMEEGAPDIDTDTGRVSIVSADSCMTAMLPLPQPAVRHTLSAMLDTARKLLHEGLLPMAPEAVVLALLSDRACACLNRQALGCTGPTNVLSFPGDPDGVAEIALAPETMLREVFLYGQDAGDYLTRLLAHGMAHVCGLDHGPAMEMAEERLVQGLA